MAKHSTLGTNAFGPAGCQRLGTPEDRIDIQLAQGRHTDVIGPLRALTREHPLRGRPWAQLMLALRLTVSTNAASGERRKLVASR